MTQTSTLPAAQTLLPARWTEPRRDKYGRPFIYLMATVIRDGETTPRYGTQVVLTTLPMTCAPDRYMVTNWMERPFDAAGNRKPEPRRFAKRAEAKAYAEALVATQRASVQQAAEAAANAGLWA